VGKKNAMQERRFLDLGHLKSVLGALAKTASAASLGTEARDLSLEALYTRFGAAVYTLAVRLCRHQADAEDVVQETFLEASKSLASFRGEGSFEGWLKRIAVTKALMRLRAEGRWSLVGDETSALFDDDFPQSRRSSPSGIVQLALVRALSTLSDVSRVVVWLHDVEGYTHDEIGAHFGASSSFSKSQLARAHRRLRAVLTEGEL
jgi:RNA polymerase sigma-70 factor (ECF subfamily)